jgi:MFS family permease
VTAQQPALQTRASIYSYFIVGVLAVVYTLNFLDRQLLSILTEPIRKDLNLTDTQIGLLTGPAFALFYTTFGIPVAWMADRTHRVRIIAAACAIWSLFSAACGIAGNFAALAVCRVGVGVGEAGGSPPSYSLVSDYFPPQRRGVGLAIYSLGVPLGSMLGSFAGAGIAAVYGWRMAFLAVGAPGVVMAILMLILIREPKRGRFDAMADGAVSHPPSPPLLTAIRAFFGNRTLVLTAISSGASAFVGYALLNWGPAFLIRNKHMALSDIKIYYSLVVGIAGVFGTFGSGWLVDRLAKRNRAFYALVPMGSFIVSLPFFLAFVWAPTWPMALTFMVVPALLNNMYLAPALAVVQNAVKPGERTTSSALLLFILNLVGLCGGPPLIGKLSDHFKAQYGVASLQIALYWLAPFFLLAIIAHFVASRSIKRDMGLANAIPEVAAAL